MKIDKVRILHVVPNMKIGGIQRFVLDIINAQKENPNVEIGIYICNDNNPQWKNLIENLAVKVYWDNLGSLTLFPKKFLHTKHSYDLIHWHFFHPALSIFTLFDDKVHIFTHHSILGPGRISKFTDNLKWKLFKNFINDRVDCEVYNSSYTRIFWQNYGLNAKRNIIIYNGGKLQEINNFQLDGRNKKKDAFSIGTITNLIACKRTYLLVEAFCKWGKDKNNVQLIIVGEGPEKTKLEKIVSQNNMNEKIIFTGHQNNVKPFRDKMDICVFPSTTETFGLAALEALNDGIPVIVMKDGGGICEVIGKNSDIVSNDDEMISRFNYYYNLSLSDYKKESVKAYKRSLLFDMKDKAKEYIHLYLDLMNGK